MKKVYITGPFIYDPEYKIYASKLKITCEEFGFEPVFPIEHDSSDYDTPLDNAYDVYKTTLDVLQTVDAVIVDVRPWRGVSVDAGAAFIMGIAAQREIPVVSYTDDSMTTYLERVMLKHDTALIDAKWIDKYGVVEDFGLNDNLMISMSSSYTDEGYERAFELLASQLE